jgi:hypothetical protein
VRFLHELRSGGTCFSTASWQLLAPPLQLVIPNGVFAVRTSAPSRAFCAMNLSSINVSWQPMIGKRKRVIPTGAARRLFFALACPEQGDQPCEGFLECVGLRSGGILATRKLQLHSTRQNLSPIHPVFPTTGTTPSSRTECPDTLFLRACFRRVSGHVVRDLSSTDPSWQPVPLRQLRVSNVASQQPISRITN